MLAGNSESTNAARWYGEPALTASVLEAPSFFQRGTEVTCRVLSNTLLAVNCLKVALGFRAWSCNSVNWKWLKENDTFSNIKFSIRWKIMLSEFLEFPYMAKTCVNSQNSYLFWFDILFIGLLKSEVEGQFFSYENHWRHSRALRVWIPTELLWNPQELLIQESVQKNCKTSAQSDLYQESFHHIINWF